MIEIRQANIDDVPGIVQVCADGVRFTEGSQKLRSDEAIEASIAEYYNPERIAREVQDITDVQSGYYVAYDNEIDKVVGAGCGGLIGDGTSSILYALWLDPNRKREGIGTKLLAAITADALRRGAKEQWVHATKGNEMGIPFYEAMGFVFDHEQPEDHIPGGGIDYVMKRNI